MNIPKAFLRVSEVTDEEFKAEMQRRGWSDKIIQKTIDGYHAIVENPDYLREYPNLKELVPIDSFVSDPPEGIFND